MPVLGIDVDMVGEKQARSFQLFLDHGAFQGCAAHIVTAPYTLCE